MSNGKEPCPLCGALPGDWVDDPHVNFEALRNVDGEPLFYSWRSHETGEISIHRRTNTEGSHSSEPVTFPYRFQPLSDAQSLRAPREDQGLTAEDREFLALLLETWSDRPNVMLFGTARTTGEVSRIIRAAFSA
ncbi:hypothetical protein [Caulobacter phage KcrB]|nr:hypothetical protein RW_GP017 [Caulobacter phage RW]WCA46321.1 hypothetical protein [Caulobacter phage KcrB]WCD56256.1 hypothetical protein [Caulobacter phage RLK]WNV48048.1 hypothetical protein GB2A_gp016 [Caulobacter phage GB2A]